MLREDRLEAVAAGKFHIWPVAKIEQAWGGEKGILTVMTSGFLQWRCIVSDQQRYCEVKERYQDGRR